MNECPGGDVATTESSRPAAIGVVSAEFCDPALEHEFQRHHLDDTARRARLTILLGATSFFVFTASDLARMGLGWRYGVLLALRSLLLVTAVVFSSRVRRTPELALSWKVVSVLESAVFAVLFGVMLFRPEQIELNNLGLSVTIVACLLLVPNRFTASVVVCAVVTVVDLVMAAFVLDTPFTRQVPSGFTLICFVVIGAMSANQLQRSRREEYLALRNQRDTNDLLVDEIARRRVLEDELTWMATHDPLTDLLNRRAFYELAEREAARARRTSQPVSILVIDADEFKGVNDRYGHQAGDEALRRIAATCRVHLRADDVVGRIGGEEFAAIMPGADLDLGRKIAERLRHAIEAESIDHCDGSISVSVSIGLTQFRAWDESVTEGIQRADEAMYLAKVAGRNRVVPV